MGLKRLNIKDHLGLQANDQRDVWHSDLDESARGWQRGARLVGLCVAQAIETSKSQCGKPRSRGVMGLRARDGEEPVGGGPSSNRLEQNKVED
jgi:hypothetical protein